MTVKRCTRCVTVEKKPFWIIVMVCDRVFWYDDDVGNEIAAKGSTGGHDDTFGGKALITMKLFYNFDNVCFGKKKY